MNSGNFLKRMTFSILSLLLSILQPNGLGERYVGEFKDKLGGNTPGKTWQKKLGQVFIDANGPHPQL